MKKLVSVCIPAYNEADVVEELARRLAAVADRLADRYDFEFIVAENGSRDDTYGRLLVARAHDARLKIVRLSRNFNQEGGVLAALAHARGDCAVIMNADLQDPPEYIPSLLAKWEEGYEHVYCIVTKRAGESAFRRFFAGAYYRLMNKVSDSPAPRDVSDFRLVSRVVYETFLKMPERTRVTRYIWPWMGFRSTGITTERPARAGGRSSFKFGDTFLAAMRHVLIQSVMPLVFFPMFGLIVAIISFVLLVGEVIQATFFGVPFNGFGTIVTLMLFLFGMVFLNLWMIAEYVGMTFYEVRARPIYIVAATEGLDDREPLGVHTVPVIREQLLRR